ncbi:SRC kinase signaling inhibitor [Homalodisca vitripennis]|nr:SRC kinase signaling inhibitor [Homalodisca vitripennis]
MVVRCRAYQGSKSGHQPYYMTHSFPPGGTPATLPRSGPLLRAYSPAVPGTKPPNADAGYMSSPERGGGAPPRPYPAGYTAPTPYEDPYYSQYGSRTGSITPVIDEEARIRVENMERQLANLTGLVQKALTQAPTPTPREFLNVPPATNNNYRNGNIQY